MSSALAEQSYPNNWIIQDIGEAALIKQQSATGGIYHEFWRGWLTEGKANGKHNQQNNPEDDTSKYTTG
jgi:hypothetical protein